MIQGLLVVSATLAVTLGGLQHAPASVTGRESSGSASLDSLSAVRDSLKSELTRIEMAIGTLEARLVAVQAADDTFAAVTTTIAPPGAFMRPSLQPGLNRIRLAPGTPVVLQGLEDEYVIVQVGDTVGYIDAAYFSGDEAAAPFLVAAEAAQVRRLAIERRAAAVADSLDQATRHEAELARQRERHAILIARYGEEIGRNIFEGRIWIGMTADMARESLGRPDKVNRTVTAGGVSEQWVYEYADLLVYFDDGFLTAWQD